VLTGSGAAADDGPDFNGDGRVDLADLTDPTRGWERRFGAGLGFVPAKAVPALVVDLYRDYEDNRWSEESFADYADRVGITHFQSIHARHAELPDHAQQPDFFRDWGSDRDFSPAKP